MQPHFPPSVVNSYNDFDDDFGGVGRDGRHYPCSFVWQ